MIAIFPSFECEHYVEDAVAPVLFEIKDEWFRVMGLTLHTVATMVIAVSFDMSGND